MRLWLIAKCINECVMGIKIHYYSRVVLENAQQ